MLKSLSWQFCLEYEELCNMAVEAALLNYEKALAASEPCAYLYGVMRNVLWYKPDEVPALSLDAPIGEDGATLSELVPAPRLVDIDPACRMKKERALYASLRKLPLEVQHYLVRVHELISFYPKFVRRGRPLLPIHCGQTLLPKLLLDYLNRSRSYRRGAEHQQS